MKYIAFVQTPGDSATPQDKTGPEDGTGPQKNGTGPENDGTGPKQDGTGAEQDGTEPEQDGTGPQFTTGPQVTPGPQGGSEDGSKVQSVAGGTEPQDGDKDSTLANEEATNGTAIESEGESTGDTILNSTTSSTVSNRSLKRQRRQKTLPDKNPHWTDFWVIPDERSRIENRKKAKIIL